MKHGSSIRPFDLVYVLLFVVVFKDFKGVGSVFIVMLFGWEWIITTLVRSRSGSADEPVLGLVPGILEGI